MATAKNEGAQGASSFRPFSNESDSMAIGEMTIENRTDQIEFYGSLSVTRDKMGLAAAQALKKLVDATIAELSKSELPDHIAQAKVKTVKNPFGAKPK